MFFTSFFSRDSAYETITKSLEINPLDECFDPELACEEVIDDDEHQIVGDFKGTEGSSQNIPSAIVKQEDDISE